MHRRSDRISLAPTDLGYFLSCRYLSSLDSRAANGLAKRPVRHGPFMDELRARGQAHEGKYLEHLRDQGYSIADMESPDADHIDSPSGVAGTLAVMREGKDIIYQAVLADDAWRGQADFLRKISTPSDLGDWSYTVIDTKLARETRASTILQLCVYSYLVEKLQGVRPENMYELCAGERLCRTVAV